MAKKSNNRKFDLKDIDRIKPLMEEYALVMSEIFDEAYSNENKIFFTTNIVGEYAELLVCEKLGLEKETASNPEYDGKDHEGKTYQIKSRWMNNFGSKNGKNEFGRISQKVANEVDYLIMIIFEGNTLSNYKMFKLDLKKNFLNILNNDFSRGTIIYPKDKNGKYRIKYYKSSFKIAIDNGWLEEIK